MASINGVQIKSLKSFIDHEGFTIYQGNVYYKGKKLGFWSQDSWGGPDHMEFDERILDAEVESFRKSDYVKDMFRDITNAEIMLAEVVFLTNVEKFFKRVAKKGYRTVVATCGANFEGYATVENSDEVIGSKDYREFVEKYGKGFVYGSLDDFNVTV